MSGAASLQDVLAALPLPTLAIGPDQRICAINSLAQNLLATSALGRNFITVLRQPELVDAVEKVLQDGKPRKARFKHGDGKGEAKFEVSLLPVGQGGSVLLSMLDTTQMTQAGQMRRDFVANVSHELRTPLTSLMGFIETLRGPARDDEEARDRFLGIMTAEAERMNRLVGDLLSLSRVEADERVRPMDQVDLCAIIQSTVKNLGPLAEEGGVTVEIKMPDHPTVVPGDADQVRQVFTNLIENAIKYGGSPGHVTVSIDAVEREPSIRASAICVTVRDTGPGIDPRHLPRLTERFYRVDSHRSRSLGGTGLGLAIVKHILNRHRGRLRIRSELGKGAAFLVILPVS